LWTLPRSLNELQTKAAAQVERWLFDPEHTQHAPDLIDIEIARFSVATRQSAISLICVGALRLLIWLIFSSTDTHMISFCRGCGNCGNLTA
jgi:hypothetical protein